MPKSRVDRKTKVKSILVTLPRPENDKSPYLDLAKKYSLTVEFRPFIHIEGVSGSEVRKQKVQLKDYSGIILTSKNAADHFFRICEEMRFEVPTELKYFCLTESIALYLQKYIQYRKRKIFFGERTAEDLAAILKKHANEKFMYPCSDVATEDTMKVLEKEGYDFDKVVIFKTVQSDLSDLADVYYDMLVFFAPTSLQSLYKNFPDFKQNKTRIATFGSNTLKEAQSHDLIVDIAAPAPDVPSMTMAIENYLKVSNK